MYNTEFYLLDEAVKWSPNCFFFVLLNSVHSYQPVWRTAIISDFSEGKHFGFALWLARWGFLVESSM